MKWVANFNCFMAICAVAALSHNRCQCFMPVQSRGVCVMDVSACFSCDTLAVEPPVIDWASSPAKEVLPPTFSEGNHMGNIAFEVNSS